MQQSLYILLSLQVQPQDDQSWWANIDFLPDEPNPQLGALYENTPLLPYDTTDQDVLSVDSGTDSLHDLINNMEDPNVMRAAWGSQFAVHDVGVAPRPQLFDSTMQPNPLFAKQGTAVRRIRLLKVEYAETITRDESEDEVSCVVTPNYLNESVEESTAEKDVASDGDEAQSTGIVIRSCHPAPSSSSESSFTQQGTAMQRLRLQLDLNKGPYPSAGDSSSCIIDESESQQKANKEEVIVLLLLRSYIYNWLC